MFGLSYILGVNNEKWENATIPFIIIGIILNFTYIVFYFLRLEFYLKRLKKYLDKEGPKKIHTIGVIGSWTVMLILCVSISGGILISSYPGYFFYLLAEIIILIASSFILGHIQSK